MRLLYVVLLVGTLVPVSLKAQVESKTPPNFLTINAPRVQDDNCSYDFEITLSKVQDPRGYTELNVFTTVTKSGDGQLIRFREITLEISPDVSSYTINLDGKQFLVQAEYPEPSSDPNSPLRMVPTTYGVMFDGGRVGITVRRAN